MYVMLLIFGFLIDFLYIFISATELRDLLDIDKLEEKLSCPFENLTFHFTCNFYTEIDKLEISLF